MTLCLGLKFQAGDGHLTSDPEAYKLPSVPWVSFFHHLSIGFHGAYWHDNFGHIWRLGQKESKR